MKKIKNRKTFTTILILLVSIGLVSIFFTMFDINETAKESETINKTENMSDLNRYSTYACVGDSISYGNSGLNDNTSWCDYLAEKLGATLNKKARNGAKIWTDMYGQIKSIPNDTNLITIMIGVNDRAAIESGEITLYGKNDNDSTEYSIADVINAEFDINNQTSGLYVNYGLIGRFRWCLEYLNSKHPNARIVVITPTPYNNGTLLTEIIKAEACICNSLGIEVYNPTDSVEFETNYFHSLQKDTLHPNEAGYKVLAGWVYQKIIKG